MDEQLRNKLLNYDAAPPESAWSEISRKLGEEFVAADMRLAEKLGTAEILPPQNNWKAIARQLDQPSKARIIALPYRRTAVAAAVLGFLLLGVVYFNGSRKDSAPAVMYSTTLPATSHAPRLQSAAVDDSISTEAPAKPARVTARKSNTYYSKRVAVTEPEPELFDVPYRPVQKVETISSVEVDAPPIRDAKGNIVMDRSLLLNTNEPYITVTGPNGLQTRISSKFINCLTYLYSNSGTHSNHDEMAWKHRFNEWRNKLLDESFVPAAGNFLDIFELKKLIEE